MIEILAAGFALFAAQDAGAQMEAACEAFKKENGGDVECGCLAEKAVADKDLMAALVAITGPEDLAEAPDVVEKAVAACTPRAEDAYGS